MQVDKFAALIDFSTKFPGSGSLGGRCKLTLMDQVLFIGGGLSTLVYGCLPWCLIFHNFALHFGKEKEKKKRDNARLGRKLMCIDNFLSFGFLCVHNARIFFYILKKKKKNVLIVNFKSWLLNCFHLNILFICALFKCS